MLTALLGIVSPIVSKILDHIPNKDERAQARLVFELQMAENETKLIEIFSKIDEKQADINIEEAKSSSLFVSGWRPAVGWLCVTGMAWAFVLKPILDWTLAVVGSDVISPEIASGELTSLLMGLLGMGALRSYEKIKGVASK